VRGPARYGNRRQENAAQFVPDDMLLRFLKIWWVVVSHPDPRARVTTPREDGRAGHHDLGLQLNLNPHP